MLQSTPVWMWIAGFLLVLGPLVTLHELGHYLVGRWFGVGAKAFSIGFGKELTGWTDSRGTRWKVSALPLGGYVQFKGDMNAVSMPRPENDEAVFGMATPADLAEEDERSVVGTPFHKASLWKRALIVFAGPGANLLITLAIFASFNVLYGKLEANTEIGGFADVSVARDAGLEVGDEIVAVDGRPIPDFQALSRQTLMYPGKDVTITVERDGDVFDVLLTIGDVTETDQFGNESRIGRLGVAAAAPDIVAVGPVEAVTLAVGQTIDLFEMMITGIVQIVTGERSVKELGGPIKIAKFSGEQLSLGLPSFVQFAAFISLNLAFINLLPIPALDGGHLAFYAAEAVRRKPVGPRGQELAYKTGIALVLMLMLVVTVNDVASLVFTG